MNIRAIIRRQHTRYKFIASLAQDVVVLDIGAGNGLMQMKLSEYRQHIRFISVDKYDYSGDYPPDTFFQVDVTSETLPIDAETIDAVFCSHVLEHLISYELLILEIRRVLKPGGKLYFESPGLRSVFLPSLKMGQGRDVPLNFYDDPTHIKPYTEQALYLLARKMGFKKIKTGKARNWIYAILSPVLICLSLLSCNRKMLALAVWNAIGWCNYLWAEELGK